MMVGETSMGRLGVELDVTWLGLLGVTAGMYWLDRSGGGAAMVAPILGLAVAKSVGIGGVFMGLIRASRSAFVTLSLSFVALGAGLVALLG